MNLKKVHLELDTSDIQQILSIALNPNFIFEIGYSWCLKGSRPLFTHSNTEESQEETWP